MLVDTTTRSILIKNLKFTPANVKELEQNTALLSNTLGLIELLRRKPVQKEVKEFIVSQFRRIRISLNRAPFKNSTYLQQARAGYYSFKRPIQ